MATKIQFKKASKLDAKLRLALCGPAGSGKTYSSLALATELAAGGKIAYIDTEHGSASKYADLFTFDVIEPETFDPRELIETIDAAVAAGYVVICVDSLSHYWMGPGGELEMVDNAAQRNKGNSFSAWKTVTPVHNLLVDKIIGAKIHVIVTMRAKTEWVIEKDERTGKSTPRKIGLQPVMRDGVEFLFDLCGDIDQENTLTVTKSRCPKLSGKVIARPSKDMADTLREWLSGEPIQQEAAPVPATTTLAPVSAPAAQQAPAPPATTTQAPKPPEQKQPDQFKVMLGKFAEIRAKVGDEQYYKVLAQFDVKHANEFRSMDKARLCYRALEFAAKVNG